MKLSRRKFLGTAAIGAVGLSPFVRGAGRPAWSSAFEGLKEDLPPRFMTVEGQIPDTCRGTLYRNGPALYERGGQRYRHWIDPDGMLQAFEIGDRSVRHRGRFVRTDKYRREAAAGRFLYNGAGTVLDGSRPARNNESGNTANINVQPYNGELLALWEAGLPYRIDPGTLETRGQLTLGEGLEGVPFSAHPRRDERGHLWNIGSAPFAGRPTLLLYHLDARGVMQKWHAEPLGFAGYMHDFILTPRYLVALNSSLLIGHGDTYVSSMRWEPRQASELLVFDREDFSLLKRIEIPPAFVFHFGNAWEENGEILFTACQYADASIFTERMRLWAKQEPGGRRERSALLRYRLAPGGGGATVEALGAAMEFPGFDRRFPFRAQVLYGIGGGEGSGSGLATAIQRIDPQTGDRQVYDYGAGTIVEEPLYVPGPDAGHVMHTWLDYRSRLSGLSILRADRLADGPIATARMDRVLPLGFHGSFLPRA